MNIVETCSCIIWWRKLFRVACVLDWLSKFMQLLRDARKYFLFCFVVFSLCFWIISVPRSLAQFEFWRQSAVVLLRFLVYDRSSGCFSFNFFMMWGNWHSNREREKGTRANRSITVVITVIIVFFLLLLLLLVYFHAARINHQLWVINIVCSSLVRFTFITRRIKCELRLTFTRPATEDNEIIVSLSIIRFYIYIFLVPLLSALWENIPKMFSFRFQGEQQT